MGYGEPVTIASTLRKIQDGSLVLPAIQREFVWEGQQIERLFDSVLREYPIGSFLAWNVEAETAQTFRFYGFLKDYHEKNQPYCSVIDLPAHRDVIAVLDGQQRLTALNIGLRGSYADRIRGGWWRNDASFPQRRLYLNVLAEAPENELGMKYDFRLLTSAQAEPPEDGSAHWFPVRRIFEISGLPALLAELASRGLGNDAFASELIGRLYEMIHNARSLYFYQEDDQDVEKVLDIFIRVNSGGTVLSYSDLLLSIATAQWTKRDAREEIRSLLSSLNAAGLGFRFPKDTVLKTGLVLTGVTDIGFKVRNFNSTNMTALEEKWDDISESLTLAANLLADFGLSDATLTANSVLIPVAYYVHHRGLTDAYRTSPAERKDREALRSWILRSLVKQGVWGSGLDTLLRDLRDTIEQHGDHGFPSAHVEARMAARGKSLVFSDEEIQELLDLNYGARRTFAVLALLFPYVDTRHHQHVDHVYPRARLTKSRLVAEGIDEADANEMMDRRDRLPNLQLLEGLENIGKSDLLPGEWAATAYPTADAYSAYLSRNDFTTLPAASSDFLPWFLERSRLLEKRLRGLLQVRSGSYVPLEEMPATRDDEFAHSLGEETPQADLLGESGRLV